MFSVRYIAIIIFITKKSITFTTYKSIYRALTVPFILQFIPYSWMVILVYVYVKSDLECSTPLSWITKLHVALKLCVKMRRFDFSITLEVFLSLLRKYMDTSYFITLVCL